MSETKTVWEKCDHGMCGPHSFTVHLNFGTVEIGMCDGGKEIVLREVELSHQDLDDGPRQLWEVEE